MRLTVVLTPGQGGLETDIEDVPFAKGGEGAVHRLVRPPPVLLGYCVKLYAEKYQTEERRRKIEYMILNPPPDLRSNVHMVCWPAGLVYGGPHRRFLGFLMPLAWPDHVLLYAACLPKPRPKTPGWLSAKFDRAHPDGRAARLKLIVNIARALHSIHVLGKYVLVDMKPQNILLTQEAKIAIVDLDSIQISDGQKVLFKAQVATPDYTPPEAAQIKPKDHYVPVSWDRFSMAVMFYQLLLGLHPYQASFKGDHAEVTTPSDAIRRGLFVHGAKRDYVDALPPPHHGFGQLDEAVQELFMRAFDRGFRRPRLRPAADEWGKTLHGLVMPSGQPQADDTLLTPQIEHLLEKGIRALVAIFHP